MIIISLESSLDSTSNGLFIIILMKIELVSKYAELKELSNDVTFIFIA